MKTLIVLLGPTAVGKTKLSMELAETLKTPILNADSRQLYRDLKIGTASPTKEQLHNVKHFFVGTLGLKEYYNAAQFEQESLNVLSVLFKSSDIALMSGGSMLYIDAVCNGIDNIPNVNESTRRHIKQRLDKEGLDNLRKELRIIDPEIYASIDLKNPRRIVHALEIYYSSGHPYSFFLNQKKSPRPFKIIKLGLRRDRTELNKLINKRVDQMMKDELLKEVQALYQYRELNALNTISYKELFLFLSGGCTLDFAIEKIKKNTRDYAKKQMTWFKKDHTITWFHPSERKEILSFIQKELSK